MARVALFVALAALLVASASAYCTKDSECPGSYCVNYHGPPPYQCHACFDYCCETNTQCADKCSTGAYCMKYPGKHGPFFCHVNAGGVCNITTTDAPVAAAPVAPEESFINQADGMECWMCEKLEPYVASHECNSKCDTWWPWLQDTCKSVCDDLAGFLGKKVPCVLAGYCSA